MESAEQLSRYLLLREICVGKRVLDFACGSGYGAYLLAQWGAESVLAIDSFPEAINKAKQLFPSEKVIYQVANANQLGAVLPPDSQFDLICGFGTIERLSDTKVFIDSITKLRGDDCIIAISVANDYIRREGVANPYHLQKLDFKTLKSLTETSLGPAVNWLFGTRLQGFALIPEVVENAPEQQLDLRAALRLNNHCRLHLVPSQFCDQPVLDNANFWVGVWGPSPLRSAVGVPRSMTSWQEPLLALDYCKAEMQKFEARVADLTGETEVERERNIAEIRRLGLVLAEERRVNSANRKRIEELETFIVLGEKPAKLDEQTIMAIAHEVWKDERLRSVAHEVWMEKRRRSFRGKLRRRIRRLFGKK